MIGYSEEEAPDITCLGLGPLDAVSAAIAIAIGSVGPASFRDLAKNALKVKPFDLRRSCLVQHADYRLLDACDRGRTFNLIAGRWAPAHFITRRDDNAPFVAP